MGKAGKKGGALQVALEVATAAEIRQVAAGVGRSVAFVVERALAAAPSAVGSSGSESLLLTADEDDPADLMKRIEKRAGARDLGAAIAGSWAATRARFLSWVDREKAAQQAERADDLDAALADAARATTSVARLSELAGSVYPKVRALVAAHPSTPDEVRAKLATDREPYVREAAGVTLRRP